MPITQIDPLATKTKEELINQLEKVRERLAQLEKAETGYKRKLEALQENEKPKPGEQDLEEQKRIYQDLFNFEEQISHLDTRRVVYRAIEFIQEETNAHRVSIVLSEEEQSGFRVYDATMDVDGLEKGGFIPYSHSIISEVVQHKCPLYRPDIRKMKKKYKTNKSLIQAGIRSYFLVPLIVEDQCIGTVNCGSQQVDGIPEKKRNMLMLFAPRLAQSIQKLKLFDAAKEQEELLNAIIESSSDGILVVDEKGKVTHTNSSFARMWRIPDLLIDTRDDKKLLDYVLAQLQAPQAFLSKVEQLYQSSAEDFDTLVFKDGRTFERHSFPLMRKEKIAGRVWSFRDITEKIRFETEKSKLENQLQHAQKMEAIGTLAGGIAHDFNNILSAIIGFTELASDDIAQNSLTWKNLEQVLTAANRAKELVKRILAFSRKDKEERKPLLLEETVGEILKFLRATLPATIEIRSHIESPLNPVLANKSQVHQVIMNLCTNAAYAMSRKGGILEIALKEIDLEPYLTASKDLMPGRYQQLSVSDTGVGMAPEIRRRIFEPYFTTKKAGEGSGLGLAVAYGIVKSHDGEIIVYSEPGQGSTFHVFFKVAEGQKAAEETGGKTGQIPGGNESILFVDDEQSLVEISKQLLKSLGYHVESTTDSMEAYKMFAADPSKYDLVISDQTMPRITGVQLTKKLKKVNPHIPVILCTGFSERINEENYQAKGISAFLMKPISKREIAVMIRSILDGRAQSS